MISNEGELEGKWAQASLRQFPRICKNAVSVVTLSSLGILIPTDIPPQACISPPPGMYNAKDYSGLLLIASSLGDSESMAALAEQAHAAGKENIAFTAYMMLNNIPRCLDLLIETERYPEAAIMAKTYMPSQVRHSGLLFTRYPV